MPQLLQPVYFVWKCGQDNFLEKELHVAHKYSISQLENLLKLESLCRKTNAKQVPGHLTPPQVLGAVHQNMNLIVVLANCLVTTVCDYVCKECCGCNNTCGGVDELYSNISPPFFH